MHLKSFIFRLIRQKNIFFFQQSLFDGLFLEFFFSSTLHLRSRSLVWESWWVSLLWQNCSVSSVNDRPFKCWNNCYLHFHKNHLSPCRSLQSIVAQQYFFFDSVSCPMNYNFSQKFFDHKKILNKKKMFFLSVQTAHNLHKLIRSRSRQIKNW